MQDRRPMHGEDVVDLLRLTGPLPHRLLTSMASSELLEQLERDELLAVPIDDDLVELGRRAGLAQVTGFRRRRLLIAMSAGLAEEPLGRVAPEIAVRVAAAVAEVGGTVREPLVRGIRAALVLGRMDDAARLAAHAHASFIDDLEISHLVAMTYEATGRHASATAIMAGMRSDAGSLGRWWSNLFLSLRGEGVLPDMSGVGDQHNELLANQAWIEIVAGDVAAVARSTATILNDPASSPQAVVWGCVAGAMAASLDGRAEVVARLLEHADQIVASVPERLTPFAALQLDLVRFLSDVRLGHVVAASDFADDRIERAPSTFLAFVWQAMSGLALRERGRFEEAIARLAASLPTFAGDNFGLVTWAHSEARVCRAMAGLDPLEELGPEPMGLYSACVERNAAWVLAAAGDVSGAMDRLDASFELARQLGQNVVAVLAIVDIARFGEPRRAASLLTEITEQRAPLLSTGSKAVLAFASSDVPTIVRAYDAARELELEPLASELGLWARRAASTGGLMAGSLAARVELRTDVQLAPTPRLAMAAPAGLRYLTAREHEIGRLAATGATSRQIAEHLDVSVRTVDNLLGRVYQKCGVGNRNELSATLAETG